MSMEAFDSGFKRYFSFLDNEYVSGALSLVLILYASSVAPKLPANIAKYMDNIFVRAVVFFLIVYMAKKNPTVALIVSVAALVTLMTLSSYKTEGMEDLSNGTCYACNCKGNCILGDKCPCRRMMHQFDEYVKDREPFMSVGGEYAVKGEYATVNDVVDQTLNQMKTQANEDQVSQTLLGIGSDVNEPEKLKSESDIVFDDESLVALREKVEYRKQNTEYTGMDNASHFAAV